MPNKFIDVLSSFLPTMFLVCKFHQYKRQQQESNRKKITEKELSHLNHKIDKLLNKLEEHDSELAANPDEECVICISAKATMQTFPCAHRVVCRKCFVKTIQVAVSQRLLPLRCVICRAKILRLKQTSQGGIDTGTVLRHHVAAVTVGHHHRSLSLASSPSSSISPSTSNSSLSTRSGPSSLTSSLTNNPFFISPITSPVSPVTEVFREQHAVWARNFDSFGYEATGQSPIPSIASPIVGTPTVAQSQIDLSFGSGCVLHKHCIGKHSSNGNELGINKCGNSPCSTRDPSLVGKGGSTPPSTSLRTSLSPSITSTFSPSSSSLSSPTTSPSSVMLNLQSSSSPSPSSSSSPSPSTSTSKLILSSKPSYPSAFTPICPTAPNPWHFQINRKRRHRLAHRRRRGHFVPSGRPTSLLLPIDEKEEWHEDCENEIAHNGNTSKSKNEKLSSSSSSSSSSSIFSFPSKRKQSKDSRLSQDEDSEEEEEDDDESSSLHDHFDDFDEDKEEDEDEDEDNENESQSHTNGVNFKRTEDADNEDRRNTEESFDVDQSDSRRDSIKLLIDTPESTIGSTVNHFNTSKLSNAFARAKNLVSKGKWRSH